jgi:DNA-binding response OmpR family regulator
VGRNCITLHGHGTLPRPRTPACLLVLEDDPLAAKLVQLAMGKKVGLELVVVGTCAEAHARLGDAWTAALVDVELPDGSGLEVIKAARRAGNAAPILCMSGNVSYRDEAQRSGATQFVEKASFCRDLAKWVATLEQWANQQKAA